MCGFPNPSDFTSTAIQACSRLTMNISVKLTVPSLLFILLLTTIQAHRKKNGHPSPTLWPERFHALLYMNLSRGNLQITDLWYDWPRRRNMNLIQKQLGPLLHDVEWNNGTSYYYTLGADGETCQTIQFEVGIPRRDWLAGSTYLGQRSTDGFLCHVWEKADFIWYYEDVSTHWPVRWDFYDGISTHVMTFELGASLEESEWQAPSYCFANNVEDRQQNRNNNGGKNVTVLPNHSLRKLVFLPSE